MNFEDAIRNHREGKLAEAESAYRELIAAGCQLDVVYKHLGIICLQTGRANEAVELIRTAISLNSSDAELHLNLAYALASTGKTEDGISSLFRAIELNPVYPEAYNNLGIMMAEKGDCQQAISYYRLALDLRPAYHLSMYNLANVLSTIGQTDEAIPHYLSVIEICPGYLDAYLNLSNCYVSKGDFGAARHWLERALEIDANFAKAYLAIGNIHSHFGEHETAAQNFRKAIELRPDYAEAYNNLGLALRKLHKPDEAAAVFQKAIEIRPDFSEALNNLGLVYVAQGRVDKAVDSYQRALASIKTRGPASAAFLRMGELLNELERLPVIYRDEQEIGKYRSHFTGCLNELTDLMSHAGAALTANERQALRDILFRIINFYLGYQQCDDRELQVKYCRLATAILSPELQEFLVPVKARLSPDNGKIRLGVASELLKGHIVTYWVRGWLANLPKDDYELFIYALNGVPDDDIASLGNVRVLPFRAGSYISSLNTMRADALDVLIIPDVGMTSSSRILSLARVAPMQAASWAHPVTTGSQNIDYFLSSDLMETALSESHYTERLVRLPKTGVCFADFAIPPELISRADFDIPAERVVYGCVQSLFKCLPQYDWVFPAIAKQIPEAFFVFLGLHSSYGTNLFVERLKLAFEREGLSYEKYVKVLPKMPQQRFMQLLAVLDASLDSIGWSGGITTMCAMAMNCPVVTAPGEFMRGRHTLAMNKVIGADELIADSVYGYVSIAAKIGSDQQFRSAVVEKIKLQKHKLFNDTTCVQYLDQFIKAELVKLRREPQVGSIPQGLYSHSAN